MQGLGLLFVRFLLRHHFLLLDVSDKSRVYITVISSQQDVSYMVFIHYIEDTIPQIRH